MADPSPLLPVSSSLEPSYNPVPEGTVSTGCPATRLRRSKKVLIAVFSGLLVVSLILATINNNSGVQHGDENASLAASRETAKPETLLPAGSRGVSAGVSEKANLKGAGVKDYPWNNSMLSWQRTAFHFQPEDNWMNGCGIIHAEEGSPEIQRQLNFGIRVVEVGITRNSPSQCVSSFSEEISSFAADLDPILAKFHRFGPGIVIFAILGKFCFCNNF